MFLRPMFLRFVIIVIASILFCQHAAAGSMTTLSNLSARYLGHLNRHATTEVDAGAYNLAGQAFGPTGFSMMATNQTWFRLERLSYRESPEMDRTNYDATNGVPSIPSFIANYNHGTWGVYAFMGIPAGGGAAFENGHPLFNEYEDEAFHYAQSQLVEQEMNPDLIYKVEAREGGSVTAKAMVIGVTVGGYYKLADWLSVGAGVRYINGKYTYLAHGIYDPYNIDLGILEDFSAEANVNTIHRAQGIAAVLGLHAQPMDGLNLGLQFHGNTKLKYTYETIEDPTGLYPNGGSRRKDLAPILGMGVSYDVTDKFQLASSWTIYFNSLSKIGPTADGGKAIDHYQTGWEGGLGAHYQLLESLTLRGGFQFNHSAHTPSALSSLTWSFDHVMVGAGVTWTLSDWLDATLGVAQLMPNGGLNADESIEFLVRRTGVGIEFGFYL